MKTTAPQQRQAGFGTSILILIMLVILGIGIIGLRVYQMRHMPVATQSSQTPLKTTPVKEEIKEPVDPTADWVEYENKAGKYTLKHPNGWYEDVCDDTATDLVLYLGTSKAARAICNSEHVSQIMLVSTSSVPTESEQKLSDEYTDKTSEDFVVDGVKGNRQSGKLIEAQLGAPIDSLIVRYFFLTPGRSYIAMYIQTPDGDYKADNVAIFDLMVQKTLTFTK